MAEEIVLEKKKKKSSKKTEPKLDEVADGVEALDLKPKKKKKEKKPKKDAEEGADAENPTPEDGGEKKKKKKKDKAAGDADPLDLDLTKPKKKKKPKDDAGKKKKNQDTADNRTDQMAAEVENKADFGYECCLDRVFDIMAAKGQGKGDRENQKFVVTLPPPKMSRMGTKKTVYENFGITCEHLNRDLKHVLNYILVEIGTTGNITDKGGLVIRGKFTSAQMEKILRPYIKEYVLCKTCKRANTTLTKSERSRLTFMDCQDCNSRTTVAVAKKGFEALTGKRKKIKLQQGGDAKLAAIK